MLILKNLKAAQQKNELMRRLREGKLPNPNKENQENESCVFIQQRIRGILARLYVEKMRDKEQQFLGMKVTPKTAEQMKNDPIVIQEQKNAERKNILEGNWKHYQMALEKYTVEIDKNMGNDLIEGMLKDRRKWINETR